MQPWVHVSTARATPRPAGGILAQNATAVRQQLTAALTAGAGAAWRFVVGHHPVASFGEHCNYGMEADCAEMRWLQPLMQVGGFSYLGGRGLPAIAAGECLLFFVPHAGRMRAAAHVSGPMPLAPTRPRSLSASPPTFLATTMTCSWWCRRRTRGTQTVMPFGRCTSSAAVS